MERVVATVSGYKGSQRSKLIKLIDSAGANFVGNFSRSTTHLICWEFKGKKYEIAKKLGTVIINHRWVEDCIRQGCHVPEYPYTQQSGKQVGLVILDCPIVMETPVMLAENKLIMNKARLHDCLTDVIDLDSDDIENDDWDVDSLLDENLFPGPGTTKTARQKSKRKLNKDFFKDNSRAKANNRMSSREPQMHTAPRFQQRNDNDITMSMDIPESSRRSRRLVRKNVNNGLASIDEEQQSRSAGDANDFTSTLSFSNNSSNKEEIEPNHRRRLKTTYADFDKGDDEEANCLSDLDGTGIYRKDSLDGECSNEKLNKGDSVDPCTSLSTSGELSCVICWTEFSSIRGVLPCGHRFCFSCIQNWADHMASSRKESQCPLCKASFSIITKVDGAASLDQKIYSQTIPNPSSTQDIFFVSDGGARRSENEIRPPSVCCNCQSLYPEDLLIYCEICQTSCVHSYCLDPPLFPWTCVTCRGHRLFYHR